MCYTSMAVILWRRDCLVDVAKKSSLYSVCVCVCMWDAYGNVYSHSSEMTYLELCNNASLIGVSNYDIDYK